MTTLDEATAKEFIKDLLSIEGISYSIENLKYDGNEISCFFDYNGKRYSIGYKFSPHYNSMTNLNNLFLTFHPSVKHEGHSSELETKLTDKLKETYGGFINHRNSHNSSSWRIETNKVSEKYIKNIHITILV